jgi:hypothetical protein
MECKLDEMHDICNLSNCIVSVDGMKSNSASPTDIWFLDFSNTYYKDKPIQNGFLKLFVDWSTIRKPLLTNKTPTYELRGLNYEILVYKDIIKNLTDYKICPNFIQYLGSSRKCTYDNILNFLKNNIIINGHVLTENEIKPILNETIFNCLVQRCSKGRPSIKRPSAASFVSIPSTLRYNMILNESIPPNTESFGKWISSKGRLSNSVIWPIMFQIAAACYAMSLSKMVHNDLHAGNLFIQELDEEKFLVYVINKKEYTIKTKYKIMIFDFDRAYAESLGRNPLLVDSLCEGYQQCNLFIENKDFVKVCCYIIKSYGSKPLNASFKTQLMNCITDDKTTSEALLYIYKDSCLFQLFKKINLSKTKIFDECHRMDDIVKKVFENIPDKYESIDYVLENDDTNDIYVCDKQFFNNDGTINFPLRKRIYDAVVESITTLPEISDVSESELLGLAPMDIDTMDNIPVDGGDRPIPINKKLYKSVINDAKKKFKKWPSAYASAWVVKEYKSRGGKYSGKKPLKTGIKRWMDEKWINVCKLPKKVPCGRPKLSIKDWKSKYPYCRPSRKITSKTPLIASKLSKTEIKRRCAKKQKSPMKRILVKKSRRKSVKKSKKSKKSRKSIKKSKKSKRKSVKKSKRKSVKKSKRKSVKKSKRSKNRRKSVKKSKSRRKSVKKSKSRRKTLRK